MEPRVEVRTPESPLEAGRLCTRRLAFSRGGKGRSESCRIVSIATVYLKVEKTVSNTACRSQLLAVHWNTVATHVVG